MFRLSHLLDALGHAHHRRGILEHDRRNRLPDEVRPSVRAEESARSVQGWPSDRSRRRHRTVGIERCGGLGIHRTVLRSHQQASRVGQHPASVERQRSHDRDHDSGIATGLKACATNRLTTCYASGHGLNTAMPVIYSYLNATSGSTRIALRTGTYEARRERDTSRNAALPMLSGSSGVTS
jgi:hypothetical protein